MVGLNGSALSEADFNPTELNGSYTTLAAKDPPPRRVHSTHAARGPKPLLPRSLKEALQLAELLSKSKLIPKGFETPETCLVGILYGMEVGLSPIAALQRMAVIDGRPTIWGDAALALVQASGLLQSIREEVIDGSGERRELTSAEEDLIAQSENRTANDSASPSTSSFTEAPSPINLTAVCTVRREGKFEPNIGTFSVKDAKRAGLWQKPGPWTDYPKRMLTMRARAFALRDAFPDVLAGLYIREEFVGAEKQQTRSSAERSNADQEWNAFGQKKNDLEPNPDSEDSEQSISDTAITADLIQSAYPSELISGTDPYVQPQPVMRRAPPPPVESDELHSHGDENTNVGTPDVEIADTGLKAEEQALRYDKQPLFDTNSGAGISATVDCHLDPEKLLDLLDSALCCALDLSTLEEIVDDFAERLRPLSKDHQRKAQKIIDRHQSRVENLDRPNGAETNTSDPDESLNAELPRGLKSLLPHLGISRMASRMRRARRKERPSQSLASWNARHRLADQGLSCNNHSHETDIDEIATSDDHVETGE